MKKQLFSFMSFALMNLFSLAQSAHSKPFSEVEKAILLPNQLTLRYVEQGDQLGVPVLFLHGYTDSWHSYELVLPHLPPFVHAYALSQRGHGDSSRPVLGYHPDDFADDISAFMNQLGIKEAVIVGHSLGGTIAQSFAVRYPEKTKGLVLISSFAHFTREPLLELGKSVAALKDPVGKSFATEFQQSTLQRPVPTLFFVTVVNETLKVPVNVWKGVMEGMLKADYSARLKAIRIPTLLVWGDKDGLATRADQNELVSIIAGSKQLVYEGTGHGLHWEEPERFANDLLNFLNLIR